MNKLLIPITLMTTTLMLSACDFSKKNTAKETTQSEWSCSQEDNLQQLKSELKSNYLKQIDRQLRDNQYYQADQALLKTINDNLSFELKNIRTVSDEKSSKTQLQCESELLLKLPKGLLKRAENAHKEYGNNCEECEGSNYDRLSDSLEDEYNVRAHNDQLNGNFEYSVVKTDNEGYSLSIEKDNNILSALVKVVSNAVFFEAYANENKVIKNQSDQYDQENSQQMQLAQKAMDIRQKELEVEKAKQVELLNQTWDVFTQEQKQQLKADQAQWFEKRDVDCKVLAQKSLHDIPESQREVYQQHSQYWDDTMRQQNQKMQFDKCFIQKTAERRVYLNNLFN